MSIIMPTYNRGYIIRRAIQSVIAQTYKNFELLVIDDGSTDDTGTAVSSFEDSRVHFISCEHRGANHARNVGLSVARGEYIAFLDSDNYWNPNYLRTRLEGFVKENIDIVFGKVEIILQNGEILKLPKVTEDDLLSKKELAAKMAICNLMDTNATCIRHECFDKNGGFDECMPRLQDWDYFLRLLASGRTVRFQDNVLVKNYILKDSISNDKRALEVAWCHILDKYKDFFKSSGCFDLAIIQAAALTKQGQMEHLRQYIVEIILDKFRMNGITSLLIYGYGYRGRILEQLLLQMGIDLRGVVDKYCLVEEIETLPIYRSCSEAPCVDAIIMTVLQDAEQICREIATETDVPVYSLKRLLSE